MHYFATVSIITGLILVSLALYAEDNKNPNEDFTRVLQTNKIADISRLKIDIATDTVILSGSVPTEKEAIAVIIAAMGVTGIKDVDTTNLIIQPNLQTARESSINSNEKNTNYQPTISNKVYQDIFTTAKIKGLFAKEDLHGNELGNMKLVNVETKNGVVYLVGTATDSSQAQKTIGLIKAIQGVKDVQLIIDKKY